MKCKRCNNQMKRQKTESNGFKYVCPKCGLEIGIKKDSDDEYKKAYAIITGNTN